MALHTGEKGRSKFRPFNFLTFPLLDLSAFFCLQNFSSNVKSAATETALATPQQA
jgi:hypothetical protein